MRAYAVFLVIIAIACDSPEEIATDAGRDAGSQVDAGPIETIDAGPIAVDAFVPSADAAVGTACAFNRECASDQRCACDEATGCFCELGARGTGRGGIDPCTDSNDCESSVCAEGPEGAYYCSNECVDDTDCQGMLPQCTDVAFVGRICIREAA